MEHGNPDHHNKFEWQKLLQEAMVEVNPGKLKDKVIEAETAIFQRLQVIGRDADMSEELHALNDATNALLVLKREILKYPDWKRE